MLNCGDKAQPQPSGSTNPLGIFIFNVGQARTKHINDGPLYGGLSLLQSFINAFKSINAKGYIVQGAMYGPEGVNIFIDTDDEDWHAAHISLMDE